MNRLLGILLAAIVAATGAQAADDRVGMQVFTTDPHLFQVGARERAAALGAALTRSFPADLRGDEKPFLVEDRFAAFPIDPHVANNPGLPKDEHVYGTDHTVIYAPGGALAMIVPGATPMQALRFGDRDFLLLRWRAFAADHEDHDYALFGWHDGALVPFREDGFTKSAFGLAPDEALRQWRDAFVEAGQLFFECPIYADSDPMATPSRGVLRVAVDPDSQGGFLRVIQVERPRQSHLERVAEAAKFEQPGREGHEPADASPASPTTLRSLLHDGP